MSHTLEELEGMSEDELGGILIPTEELFAEYPKISISPFYTRLAQNGAEIYLSRAGIKEALNEGDRVRMADESGEFFALGETRQYPSGLAMKPIKFFKGDSK
jgi:tRNA U55 pseudouridine synthase TruB